ncbi:MAG: hypothetical protein GF401_10410 [Chitinivibrionales bacterium]|nr:hypothetical protein [Chitinivibrionales bacterium]
MKLPNLKLKELIAIGAVAILSFPVMYMTVLFMTGHARIEFGPREFDKREEGELRLEKQSERIDSLAAVHSKSFQANQQKLKELEKEREKLIKQQEHVAIMQQELESAKTELIAKKKEMEQLVKETSELEKKRIRQLAKVYGSMRATEAARILETLDDDLLIKILNSINDDRQKAKIVAAISQKKASRISKKMGKSLSDL